MPFNHRVPALATAALATIALALATLSGVACEFLEVTARPGNLLMNGVDTELLATTTTLGILCENRFYEADGDRMWELSRIFLYVGLGLGGLSVILSLAVSTFLAPTEFNWRLLSFLSSLTAVLQVPIFLLFEADPCAQNKATQQCTMAPGSYFLITSTVFWVGVTICTQCLDPPMWALELSAWRTPRGRPREVFVGGDDHPDHLPITQPGNSKGSNPRQGSWCCCWRSKQSNLEVPAVATESMMDSEFDPRSPTGESYDDNIDSRLVLRVQPNGKLPGDEVKSAGSFEDLDSFVRMVEEGRQKEKVTNPMAQSAMRSSPNRNSRPAYLNASEPSQATERLTIVADSATSAPKGPPRVMKRTNSSPQKQQGAVHGAFNGTSVSNFDILADLQADGASTQTSDRGNSHGDGAPLIGTSSAAPADSYNKKIRSLTKKLKKDSRRQKVRRIFRQGYQQMMDDDDESSDDEPYMSPPIEVNIQPFANFDNLNFANEITDDEKEDLKEDLMEDWNALHAATSAGVRMGLNEGSGSSQGGKATGLDDSFDSYHSDPEPAYYTSDESKSKLTGADLQGFPTSSRRDDDNSTLSDLSGARSHEDPRSHGRRARHESRRRHRSPNSSLKSGGSLMGLTIDEETDQDILEESSVGEDALGKAYTLSRTLSAPEPRGRSADRNSLRRGRRDGSQRKTLTVRPYERDVQTEAEEKKDDEAISSRPVNPLENMGIQPAPQALKQVNSATNQSPDQAVSAAHEVSTWSQNFPPTANENQEGVPEKLGEENPEQDAIAKHTNKKYRARSLSPARDRPSKPPAWKSDAVSVDGRYTRGFKREESLRPKSPCSHLSERAREFRIRRLQRMKKKHDTSEADDSNRPKGEQGLVRSTPPPEEDLAQTEACSEDLDRSTGGNSDEVPFDADDESVGEVDPELTNIISRVGNLHMHADSGNADQDEFLNFDYGNPAMDSLDLQLIEVRRPIGMEYGADEVSL